MRMHSGTSIIRAGPGDMGAVRELFLEYEAFLNVDLCFQDFAEELAGLPGKYAPPRGALFIALVGGRVAGCVALRPHADKICEMKRLFVRPDYRGLSLGRELACTVIEESIDIGYQRMWLDTLDFLKPAIHIYTSLGFHEIESYYNNPLKGVMYWELDLKSKGKSIGSSQ